MSLSQISKKKILALSPKWAVLSKPSPGVYTYWRCLCSLCQARAACSWSSGVLTVANTHIPGERDDCIKWQGCRRRCINLQSREIHRPLFPKMEELLEAFQHWRQWWLHSNLQHGLERDWFSAVLPWGSRTRANKLEEFWFSFSACTTHPGCSGLIVEGLQTDSGRTGICFVSIKYPWQVNITVHVWQMCKGKAATVLL